jgi:hypothetical protein
MIQLTAREIEILSKEIEKQGLTYTQLQKELLDHLCCDIEAKMEEGIEFLKAFEEVKSRLDNNRIQEIQEETLLLINQKYRMMKKFMYILGTIAPSLLIVGAILKIQHLPGASVLIILGTFLLAAVYLPVFAMVSIRDTRKTGKKANKTLYITGVISGFIFLTGVLFKIMHWPGAGVALMVSEVIMVVAFIPILVTQALRDKENQVQTFSILIFIVALIAVNTMFFALKVSKNVLTSMAVSTQAQMITSQAMETRNTLFMEQVMVSGQEDSVQLLRATYIIEGSDALDRYIQEMMAEIVLLTNEKNRAAVHMDNSIDLKKAAYFDETRGVYMAIFGNEEIAGRGEALADSVEAYRNLLLSSGFPELDEVIDQLLYTGPMGENQESWLSFNFNMVPMIGALNLLANLQVNLRFLEGEVLSKLL